MSNQPKPLAKSLHTVTVLVRLAAYLEEDAMSEYYDDYDRVGEACRILGIDDKPDTYGLREAALKQLKA